MQEFDWYFLPVANPDGYEYSHTTDRMWRKTRNNNSRPALKKFASSSSKLRQDDEECAGADINRNFNHQWRKAGASKDPCSGSFAGMKPFSEPETRALSRFIFRNKENIAMYISLHSYSQMWLLPWGYTSTKPDDFSELVSLAKVAARAQHQVNNSTYLIGTIPDLLYTTSGKNRLNYHTEQFNY